MSVKFRKGNGRDKQVDVKYNIYTENIYCLMSEQSRAHARGFHLGTGDSRHTDKTLDRCLESGHSLVTPGKVTGPDNRGQGQHADIYLSNNSLFSLSLKYGDMSYI